MLQFDFPCLNQCVKIFRKLDQVKYLRQFYFNLHCEDRVGQSDTAKVCVLPVNIKVFIQWQKTLRWIVIAQSCKTSWFECQQAWRQVNRKQAEKSETPNKTENWSFRKYGTIVLGISRLGSKMSGRKKRWKKILLCFAITLCFDFTLLATEGYAWFSLLSPELWLYSVRKKHGGSENDL